MPRPRITSLLPPLVEVLRDFAGFSADASKTDQISNILRQVIRENRKATSIGFYALRDVVEAFGVSLRTANLAVINLQREGLLVTRRGSHTHIPGIEERGGIHVLAHIGMPSWAFGIRYSYLHQNLPVILAELLWKQNMALETIMFSEVGDQARDFTERLLRHKMDFALWLYPFRHNREAIIRLNDAGVANIVIQHEWDPQAISPHIVTKPSVALAKVFTFWKEVHGIRHVIIPEGREYNRGRSRHFVRLAQEHGLSCEVHRVTPELASLVVARNRGKQGVGIALLDEHATAEFCHLDPYAFTEILKTCRVLFGNNTINIPFVPDVCYTVERLFDQPVDMAPAISQLLQRWQQEGAPTQLIELPMHYDEDWPLSRYV